METKQFYLTSEFWITVAAVITAVVTALSDTISHDLAAILAAIAAGAYAISRGFAKSGVALGENDEQINVPKN